MPFPFRTPASQEEEWKPPDYAVPVKASSDSEEWSPPSYATPVSKKKEGPSAFSRAIEALKPAKTIKPTGSLIPEALKTSEMKAIGKPPQPPTDYGKRPDGTQKGEGFLGMFKLPNNSVASEYSIANSEKLKDEKGNYLDYPSLVPTLTREEVQAVLKAAAEGKSVPQSVEAKAEAHALKRKAEGRSLFAQPGEEDYTQHMDLARASHYESDEERAAKKKPEEKSLFSRAVESASKFLSEHPKIREAGQRFLTGTSPEFEAEMKKRGVSEIQGPGVMSIPGVKQATDYLSQKVAGSEGNTRLAAGAVIQALGGILEGGFDPRTAGIKGELPIRQPSREIPYRMEESVKIRPPEISTVAPTQTPEELKPKAEIPAAAAAVEAKKPFVSPFEKKTEKPLEQTFGEFGGVGHPDEPGYADRVLKRAGAGEPGLAVEPVEGLDNVNHVVYRNKDGEPIAAAMVVKDQSGKTLVQDLAADKSKGLLTGRAMKALGGKLEELGATEAAGTVSPDAQNFIAKMKERAAKPAKEIESLSEWKPPEYAKPVEKEPELVTVGGSGESAASQEAINRQASMKAKGEQYVVYDRAGNARPLIGPEAVDYQPRPGETFGIITQKRGFRVLEDRGGNFRKSGLAEFASSEEGGMRWEGPIPGGGEPFSGRPESRTLNKLFNALEDAKENVGAQEILNRQERARRFAAFSGVKEEGVVGAAKSLGKLKGEFAKVQSEALGLNQKESDSLFTAIKGANITAGEKARGYTALFKLMNGEGTPVRSELKILDDVFGNGFADKVVEMHGGLGAVGLKVSKLASTMKSMQNALSLAAPLRHGIGLVYKSEFYPAFKDMFKFFANKEFYSTSMKALEERPNYLLGRDSGLFLAKPGSLQGAEEEFLNSYVGALPGIRNVVGASQRAYTGFLNKLRADVFDSMVKQAEGLGAKMSVGAGDSIEATREARAIAKFINNATGRGDLGSLNKMTNELNTLFWSPRMIASRVNMIANPKIYMDLPKGMRLEGLKSLLGIAALGTTIDTLAAYGGAKISSNILSTDFGKSRFGTKLIDPWGGFQQYVVFAARFLAGKTDSPKPTDQLEITGKFLKNKESPVASLIHNILTAKSGSRGKEGPGTFTTQYGQPTSIQKEVGKTFTPIFIQDLQTLAQSEPDWSENVGLTAAMAGASLTGMAQEYPEKQKGKLGFRKMKLKP